MSSTASNIFTAEYRLNAIILMLQKHEIMFSKTEAAQLLGGRGRLCRLIEQGKVRVEKPTAKQNGKWYCNAADVITYMKLV